MATNGKLELTIKISELPDRITEKLLFTVVSVIKGSPRISICYLENI
jgi:hypothetical protein